MEKGELFYCFVRIVSEPSSQKRTCLLALRRFLSPLSSVYCTANVDTGGKSRVLTAVRSALRWGLNIVEKKVLP